jgi:hypothetical protein
VDIPHLGPVKTDGLVLQLGQTHFFFRHFLPPPDPSSIATGPLLG